MRYSIAVLISLLLSLGASTVDAACLHGCTDWGKSRATEIALALDQPDSPAQTESDNTTTTTESNAVNTLKARRVKVNFYLNSISNVNDDLGSYDVDLWLDLFWYDAALEGKTIDQVDTSTLWTPKAEFVNARNVTTLYESFDNGLEEGTNVRLSQRLVITFFTNFDLRRFPFDQQILLLKLESNEYDSSQVLFDFATLEQPPAHSEQAFIQPIPLGKYFLNDSNLQGWTLSDSRIVQQIRVLPYDKSSWSQLRIEITATRYYQPYLWKIILVLLFLILLIWGVFWLEVGELRYRLLLLCTLLLALTTLDYKMVQILPQTSYMTSLDLYTAVCYGLLVGSAVIIVLCKALYETVHKKLALRINFAMIALYPLIIVVINLGFFWYGLGGRQ